MDKLSTELDAKITNYLLDSTPALSAFSKVSKYYRKVVEPYLYKNIVLKEYHDHTLKRLFFTLLDRKNLALHIQSVTIVENIPRYHSQSDDEDEDGTETLKQKEAINLGLWDHSGAIQRAIGDV